MRSDSPSSTKWYVYMIEAESGKLYTGISTDVNRRYKQHERGKGARFFQLEKPKKIVFTQSCENHSEALKLEHAIKKLPRLKKWKLVWENET